MTNSAFFGNLFCLHMRENFSDWLQWVVLRKSYKNSYKLLPKKTSRKCVVIDYSFCQAARVVSEKTSFSCFTTHICKGLIGILSHLWSIKIVKIEVAGFKPYIRTRKFSNWKYSFNFNRNPIWIIIYTTV